MKNLIYYPTFEPQSLNWLKYALVYIEDFSPIIPVTGRNQLSDLFMKVEDNTELIKSIEPTWQQGERATINAIKELELIIAAPARYASFFNDPNIIDKWSNPLSWNQKLYREKFSFSFEEYCIANKFGLVTDEGLLISEELASFYMTFLAEEIALERQASPITDMPELDGLSSFLRTKNAKVENQLVAKQAIIDLHLPMDIDNIGIDKFIEFRNDGGIKELRASYNETVEAFYNSVEQNFDPYSYLDTLKTINASLLTEIYTFFGLTAAFALNCFLVTNHLNSGEVVAKLLEGGVAINSINGVRKEWKLSANRRNARKFMSRVRKLN